MNKITELENKIEVMEYILNHTEKDFKNYQNKFGKKLRPDEKTPLGVFEYIYSEGPTPADIKTYLNDWKDMYNEFDDKDKCSLWEYVEFNVEEDLELVKEILSGYKNDKFNEFVDMTESEPLN